MIEAYAYCKKTLAFKYVWTGDINSIALNTTEYTDFTLQKPPNYEQLWYWIDNRWTTETAN